jgi:hypothetical protein
MRSILSSFTPGNNERPVYIEACYSLTRAQKKNIAQLCGIEDVISQPNVPTFKAW